MCVCIFIFSRKSKYPNNVLDVATLNISKYCIYYTIGFYLIFNSSSIYDPVIWLQVYAIKSHDITRSFFKFNTYINTIDRLEYYIYL